MYAQSYLFHTLKSLLIYMNLKVYRKNVSLQTLSATEIKYGIYFIKYIFIFYDKYKSG